MMQTIYHINTFNVYDGINKQIADDAGCPPGWTFYEPPVVPEGEYAYFIGDGWVIIDELPNPPAIVEVVVNKIVSPNSPTVI